MLGPPGQHMRRPCSSPYVAFLTSKNKRTLRSVARRAASGDTSLPAVLPCHPQQNVDIAVLGDLHLQNGAMQPFHEAREHFQVRHASLAGCSTKQHICIASAVQEKREGASGPQQQTTSLEEEHALHQVHSLSSCACSALYPACVLTASVKGSSLQAAFAARPDAASHVLQLGDLGTGATSGSSECFETARHYLQSFDKPFSLITGNHDLEGAEFDTDTENLDAWRFAFQQSHFWARDVGPCVLIGLSTTRYRSNVMSHHEVRQDLLIFGTVPSCLS